MTIHNYRYQWNCRCMGNGNRHDGGVELMSGTWKVHCSIIHHIYPYGLHRVLYRLKDNDLNNIFEDDCWIKVVYRNSYKLSRIRRI